jgi:hypothetical protein
MAAFFTVCACQHMLAGHAWDFAESQGKPFSAHLPATAKIFLNRD